jgi:hypothetical protein
MFWFDVSHIMFQHHKNIPTVEMIIEPRFLFQFIEIVCIIMLTFLLLGFIFFFYSFLSMNFEC